MSTGLKDRKKIRVAFINYNSEEWIASFHYLRNLLYAISKLENCCIEPVVLTGTRIDKNIVEPLRPYATIVRSPLFERKSFWWFAWKLIFFSTGSHIILNKFLKKNCIQVLSHTNIISKSKYCKFINWIPDFQHFHLPEMFSIWEKNSRNATFKKIIRDSDAIIVSSYDALKDLNIFMPGYEKQAKVLSFVSQPSPNIYGPDTNTIGKMEKKYSFSGRYFYLPNQFWKHKNHKTVFEAINILKNEDKEVLLLCSGFMHDYRNKDHVQKLKNYIKESGLEKNIRLLGLIDYEDVFVFMRNSIAVINPSLFEGWSSTVEECKSFGKSMILSNLNVHKEQNPPGSTYFDPLNAQELAYILQKYWDTKKEGPDHSLEEKAKKLLPKRTHEFGLAYQDIVLEACGT